MKKSVLVLFTIVFATGLFAQTTGTFIDKRDGKTYETVKIGNQVWMAENLAYKPRNGKYWAYNNNKSNVAKYGYLYDWETAKKNCPDGWRLPTQYDWLILLNNYKGEQSKETYNALIKGGSSNFNIIFSGLRTNKAQYEGMPKNKFAGFWSISYEISEDRLDYMIEERMDEISEEMTEEIVEEIIEEVSGGWSLIFSKEQVADVMRGAHRNKRNGLSVRCIKGEPIEGDNETIHYKCVKEHYENGQIRTLGITANGVVIGEWKMYHDNGNIQAIYNFSEGKVNGKVEIFYKNGHLESSGSSSLGIQVREWKNYYETGKLKSIGEYSNSGEKEGKWKTYHENGKLSTEGNYSGDVPSGKWEYYSNDGILLDSDSKTSSFTDSRDGKTYKTVKIGNQVWMAENFAYKPNNGNSWAYNNDESNIAKYGCFYDWETAKNIAPKGWHLPSEEEYLTLLSYYDEDYHAFIAGGKSYFNAVLLGIGYQDGQFQLKGDFAGFWATSNTTYRFVPHFKIHARFENAEMDTGDKTWGLNVRLIKD